MGCVNDTSIPSHRKYQIADPDDPIEIPEHEGELDRMPYHEVAALACGYGFHHALDFKQESGTKANLSSACSLSEEISFNELLQQYELCRGFYQEHDIDQAHQHSVSLQALLQKYESPANSGQSTNPVHQSQIKKFRQLVLQVQQEYSDVLQFEGEINKGGWSEKSHKSGVKISTRREGQTVGVLVEALVDQPFEVIISVLIEIDLYCRFTPFMKVSRQEKNVARNCRIGYTENHIPFLSVRQAFFQGVGYNRLQKDNTLFLFTRSIHNRKDLQEKLGYTCKVNHQNVQLDYKYLVIKYEPLGVGKGKFTMAMNIDTKMDFLPMWAMDKVCQDFGNEFFENIMKLSKNFKGSQWEKNVEKNPDLFNFFKKVIDNHLSHD